MTRPARPDYTTPLLPLAQCGFDTFESGLLPVLRHFLTSFAHPERHGWQLAYTTASERWGDSIGLPAAHSLLGIVRAVLVARPEGLWFQDPLCLNTRESVTMDERAFLDMLRHMRRDATPQARTAVEALTEGRMDPGVIRAGLSFARRFPAARARPAPTDRPHLRVVG